MDLLFEFIFELVFDTAFNGAVSAAGSRKLPAAARYLILTLIMLVFASVFFFVFLAGALLLKDGNYAAGALMLLLGAFMVFMSVRKFRIMREKVRKSSAEDEDKGE